MARILAVGTAALDLIFSLDQYPREDADLHALNLRVDRGGNAANTLVVLSQLGHSCTLAGVLADGPEAVPILDDLARYRIDLSACRRVPGRPPTSCVLLSSESGTRTIVHYRDLPEYIDDDLRHVDLTPFDWVHFEGRDATEIVRMLRRVGEARRGIPCSVEVEKPRPGIEAAFPNVAVLIFSRAYAHHRGFESPHSFLVRMREEAPEADLVLTWGEDGAYGLGGKGEVTHSPAFRPIKVKETLGAGDTFNAGVIDAYVRGLELAEALPLACRLAGKKCGQVGFTGLGEQSGAD
jgi:ketohexokinase